MKNIYNMKPRKVGEVSSKYAYAGGEERFVADLKAGQERAEFLWSEFVAFMKAHDATPQEFRRMFTRYYEEFIEGEQEVQ